MGHVRMRPSRPQQQQQRIEYLDYLFARPKCLFMLEVRPGSIHEKLMPTAVACNIQHPLFTNSV